MLDVSDSETQTELLGNRQRVAPVRGAVTLLRFETDSRKPWFIKARLADGSPLTFGYDVVDSHGHNIGLVGQGSRLFIRSNEVPYGVSVVLDPQQGRTCTLKIAPPLDENQTYICH